jgi:hypothetical protein
VPEQSGEEGVAVGGRDGKFMMVNWNARCGVREEDLKEV